MERLVKFEICGQEYSLNTDAPDEEVQETLVLVKSQIEMHSKSGRFLPAKLAMLVSLNMASKYIRLKKDFEAHRLLVDTKLAELTRLIEKKM